MIEEVILDFCGACAVLLPPNLGAEDDPTCPNCGASVKGRSERIRGVFEKDEAVNILALHGFAL